MNFLPILIFSTHFFLRSLFDRGKALMKKDELEAGHVSISKLKWIHDPLVVSYLKFLVVMTRICYPGTFLYFYRASPYRGRSIRPSLEH